MIEKKIKKKFKEVHISDFKLWITSNQEVVKETKTEGVATANIVDGDGWTTISLSLSVSNSNM